MAIGRSQMRQQIDGKLRGARSKKRIKIKKKPNSKKPRIFKV